MSPRLLRCGVLAAAAALAGCSTGQLVVLLPGDGGEVGSLEVGGGWSAPVTLDTAYAGARSGLLGRATPVAVPDTQVHREFAPVLAAQPPAPVTYLLYFEEGTTQVVPESRPALERMLADVAARAVAEVQVTGHTDRLGTVEDNDALARERAAMVRAVLIRQGLAPGMIRAVGRGEREPLLATDDEVREPRNRRVEITVR